MNGALSVLAGLIAGVGWLVPDPVGEGLLVVSAGLACVVVFFHMRQVGPRELLRRPSKPGGAR